MRVGSTTQDEPVSLAVVKAISTRAGRSPEELRPLHDVVDTDGLNSLFRDDEGSVTFPYEGFLVTVDATGSVHLEKDS